MDPDGRPLSRENGRAEQSRQGGGGGGRRAQKSRAKQRRGDRGAEQNWGFGRVQTNRD